MNWQAFTLTARLAAAAAAILMLVGIPIALRVAYSQRRWKFMVESVVALPLILCIVYGLNQRIVIGGSR